LVRDGVADAAWIFHGYNTRYLATQAVEMPNLGTGAEAASVAYWRVHEKYLAKANEHKGVTLAGLSSHGQAVIQTKSPLTGLGDLKGLKIRVPGGVGSKVGKALGVVAVKLPAPKVYEALSSGVADGIFMPMETQKSFRLKEVVPHEKQAVEAVKQEAEKAAQHAENLEQQAKAVTIEEIIRQAQQ